MRKTVTRLVFSTLTAGLLAIGMPGAAHAATGTFVRFSATDEDAVCRYYAVNDVAPGAALGGPTMFTGVVTADYVAPLNTGPHAVTVSCQLVVNGTNGATVLGPTAGINAVVTAAPLQFVAVDRWDQVDICAHIVVDGIAQPDVCTQGGWDDVDGTIGIVDDNVCVTFWTLAPTVNGLNIPTIVRIDPTSGDLYVGGFLLYDCTGQISG